jgi:Domain of unknown function (DUF4390)
MMAFITLYCKKILTLCPENGQTRWSLPLFMAAACCCAQMAAAQVAPSELTELRLERRESALVLNAQLNLELSAAIEDALHKGLAVHFVAEVELLRDRWYWYDKKVSTVARHYRLAYQPLTRRWRLNVATDPLTSTGLAGSIAQNLDSLPEALDIIRRQSGWRVVLLSDWDPDARHNLTYRFKLDTSLLPRPFQITAGNQVEWSVNATRFLRITPDMVR